MPGRAKHEYEPTLIMTRTMILISHVRRQDWDSNVATFCTLSLRMIRIGGRHAGSVKGQQGRV